MSYFSHRQIVCILLILGIFGPSTVAAITYTFRFQENDLNNFFLIYYLNVQIDIGFMDDGTALFTTSVLNVSPFHFSMFVNGRNCGIINLRCQFTIQPNQQLNIVVNKIDMESNLLSFLYKGGSQSPDVYINGCSETIKTGLCAFGSQLSTDTQGNDYDDSICVCHGILSSCIMTSNDSCIANHPFWNYQPTTSMDATSTTRFLTTTTAPTSTTVIPTTTTVLPNTTLVQTTTKLPTTKLTTTTASTSTTMTTKTTTPLQTTTPILQTIKTTTRLKTTTTRTTTSMPTTTTSSTSTTVKNSTNATSSMTSSTTTSSPPTTTTTPDAFVPTLKNLSDSGVGPNNVSTVLNETLTYSKMGPNLNSTQVMEISTILVNAANVPGLTTENSYQILHNLDNMLYVDPTTMYQSGNSAQRVLNSLGTMVDNTMDQRIEYLEGTNLGFSSKKINCQNLSQDDGLLDLGSKFELINSTDSLGKWHSILVPLSDLCSTQALSHVFFTIYRDTSLFVGQQQYRSYTGTNHPISSGQAETYTPPPQYRRSGWDEEDSEIMNVTSREFFVTNLRAIIWCVKVQLVIKSEETVAPRAFSHFLTLADACLRLRAACRPLADRLPTACRPLADRLPTASRPLVDHLSTFADVCPMLTNACRRPPKLADAFRRYPNIRRRPPTLANACRRFPSIRRRLPTLPDACQCLPTLADAFRCLPTLADISMSSMKQYFSETVPLSPCARQTSLPSTPVMSATVLNNGVAVSISSTSDAPMALLRFNVSTLLRPLHGSLKVTWWDVGRRQWADNRECEIITDSDGILEARCTHLTDFAIIVDAALNDPNVCDNALITLGYVVNGLSIFSLVFLTFFSLAA
ncbi:hypothetical protein L5515_013202 [Caenorhabditis briggsae]|uniref:GPS domain-containing protein n=1 Tax=Caenorhabditis briggsae TaxID=6238 RepID=A0AAE9E5S2_CAEBR|nr:hypothetical protein L5515_013202 [Caenorhabditis briggsae]